MSQTIDLYTTSQCGFCTQLKTVLDENNLGYTEHNVSTDVYALEEMKTFTQGIMSVPVTVIDKGNAARKVTIGYDEAIASLGLNKDNDTPFESVLGILTCPKCKHQQQIPIPTNSCVPFYECQGCGRQIEAKEEDCCVFCSYGDQPCPLKSSENSCSGGTCSI